MATELILERRGSSEADVTEEVPDTVEKLNSVIRRLEEATNDNLAFLEKALDDVASDLSVIENLKTHNQSLLEKLNALETEHPETKPHCDSMRVVIEEQSGAELQELSEKLHEHENLFMTILTNQGFQDLTGQTLKKVIDFLEHLEFRLLELIQRSSQYFKKSDSEHDSNIDFMTKMDVGVDGEAISLHGPDEAPSQKSSQSDVDALLAGMGF